MLSNTLNLIEFGRVRFLWTPTNYVLLHFKKIFRKFGVCVVLCHPIFLEKNYQKLDIFADFFQKSMFYALIPLFIEDICVIFVFIGILIKVIVIYVKIDVLPRTGLTLDS